MERFVQSVKQDERARENMREAAAEHVDRQIAVGKRLWEKLSSMEVGAYAGAVFYVCFLFRFYLLCHAGLFSLLAF
jgi:hypothetical protein